MCTDPCSQPVIKDVLDAMCLVYGDDLLVSSVAKILADGSFNIELTF